MNRFTEDYCKAVAMSCETTSEFRKKHHAVAMKAQKMGWYESYTWLRMDRVPRNYWTYETCKAEASKFKTLEEFRVKSQSAYVIANKKGWLKSFGLVRKRSEKHFWTEDTCRTEALKYKTISDFREGCFSAYNMAAHKGWVSSFTFLERRRAVSKK